MTNDTILETELRAVLLDLTVPPDDALADEMSARAARRRRRSLLPLQAAASVVAIAAATVALGTATHDNSSVTPRTSLTPAEERGTTAPSQPAGLVLRLRCVAPGGRVTESTVTTTPNKPRSADDGNWARVYLPKADGTICTEISREPHR